MEETFGEKLKELRIKRKLNQKDLAQLLGVGKSIISAWELNKNEPTIHNLVAIAKFFDVSSDYLIGLED